MHESCVLVMGKEKRRIEQAMIAHKIETSKEIKKILFWLEKGKLKQENLLIFSRMKKDRPRNGMKNRQDDDDEFSLNFNLFSGYEKKFFSRRVVSSAAFAIFIFES